jgi:release factor glutamine methyltransferase
MKLNQKQKKQVALQLKAHAHSEYKADVSIIGGLTLKNFSVIPNILRPEIMNALQLAQWLCLNNGLYKNKSVIDIGTGTGIQGIVMAMCGAKKIICSDISKDATKNANINIKKYKLSNKIKVIESDLFQRIKSQKFDLIVFNHPFFSDGSMEEQLSTSFSLLERGNLIHRFFTDAKKFLKKDGLIVMPYYHLAGPINDPAVQAPKNGYKVLEKFNMNVTTGLQKGSVSIYEIRLNRN